MSYLDSHTAPEMGRSYDEYYETTPFLGYIWGQEQAVLDTILSEFYDETAVDLLDFACGTGRIAAALENSVRSATGVDVSESMLDVAREKLHRTELINANLLDEPALKGRTYNLITAFRFFPNAEPELRSGALQALEPLLTDDGYFVFNNHQNASAMYTRLARAYHRLRHRPTYPALSLTECEKLLATVGLQIERIYPLGLLHLPSVDLPHALYRAADKLAASSRILAAHTEMPIIVARRSTRTGVAAHTRSPLAACSPQA